MQNSKWRGRGPPPEAGVGVGLSREGGSVGCEKGFGIGACVYLWAHLQVGRGVPRPYERTSLQMEMDAGQESITDLADWGY